MANVKPVRWLPEAAAQFLDPIMVADYAARDAFNPQIVALLRALSVPGKPILDVGCGCGHLTTLLPGVNGGRVDAVDPSEAMLSMAAASLPKSIFDKIHWYNGTVEDSPQTIPDEYGLVTAADSIHWTDWPRFFPTIRAKMLPGAYLVIAERFKGPTAWKVKEKTLVSRYYTEKDQGKYDPVDEIVARGYFRLDGTHITPPMLITKTPEDYIRERHSRNGCSRVRMGKRNTRTFNRKMLELLDPYIATDGFIRYECYTKLRWGIVM